MVGALPISGIRGVEYNEEQEKEVIHGAGAEPLGIGRGNKTYSGSVTLLQSAVQALEAASPTKSILDLQFNIVIHYNVGTRMHTDIVLMAEITKVPKWIKQGDKFSEHQLDFIALGIQKGA